VPVPVSAVYAPWCRVASEAAHARPGSLLAGRRGPRDAAATAPGPCERRCIRPFEAVGSRAVPGLRRPVHARRISFAVAAVVLVATGAGAASIEVKHAAVAAEHRLASMAGVEILERGGNAMDAAVAAALATGVVNPSSSGLGGGGFVVWWNARCERATTIDFRETAPRGAAETMFVRPDGSVDPEASRTGALAVGVPGEPRGLARALEKHGTVSFAEAAAPAIRLARDGFPIEAHLANAIASGRARLAADPELAAVFLHPDGSPKKEGELLKRPALAATLERLATAGVDDFYEGEIAAEIARAVAARHAKESATTVPGASPLDAKDLLAYRPVERKPLSLRYRGRAIETMPPPSSGGGVLGEVLGILSRWNIGALDPAGPTWGHLLGESMKLAFADRAQFYGDPAYTDVGLERLLGRAHIDAMSARLDWKRSLPSAGLAPRGSEARDGGTSHISVVDAHGNAAALTTSVNTAFGAGFAVPGRDIVLNNTMDDFVAQPGKPNAFGLVGTRANAVAPGKRPLSSMTPVIVTRDGDVELVAGGSGGPLIITATLQAVVGVIDFGRSTDEAVSAPRLHHQWMPDKLFVEKAYPEATRRRLAAVGHSVADSPARASVQQIRVIGSGPGRSIQATSDPRKGGVPAGY
jgi:gamma-glutamyltranspeptidase/glutathione hydrolase